MIADGYSRGKCGRGSTNAGGWTTETFSCRMISAVIPVSFDVIRDSVNGAWELRVLGIDPEPSPFPRLNLFPRLARTMPRWFS